MGRKKVVRPLVLVAETSVTIGGAVEAALVEAGYKVMLVSDGVAVLGKLVRSRPDCLVMARTLAGVDGLQLCGIVKDGLDDWNVPVVLYDTDSQEGKGTTGYAPADVEVTLEEGMDKLVGVVEELLKGSSCLKDSSRSVDSCGGAGFQGTEGSREAMAAGICCTAHAMDKNMELYTMLRAIYQAAAGATCCRDLAMGLLESLRRILGCQVAAMVLNSLPATLYHSGTGILAADGFSEFCCLCQADYETAVSGEGRLVYDVQPHQQEAVSGSRLASYRYIALWGQGFIGTLHLASTRQDFFSSRRERALDFFGEHCSIFLEQTLQKVQDKLEMSRLRSTLSQFIPSEIIDALVQGDSQSNLLANETRRVAILFCDIRNFTVFCENTQPEHVVSFLNSYFTTMVNIIKKHGGSIDKFIGDAIMAIFGAPVSYEDNERRAVEAALEMRRAFPLIQGYGRQFLHVPLIEYGIGIHCGDVIVGNIGCADKTNYTVIGDSVNIAFRLEGITKAYHIPVIISQTVRDMLEDNFNCFQLDVVNVKGKSVRMPIYRVDEEMLSEEYRENYRRGLNLYLMGAWSRAAEYFDAASSAMEDDTAAMMARRCREFVAKPPENWNGTYVFTTK